MKVAISHMTLWVTDQEKALEFYRDKLGWEVRMDSYMGDFRWLTVAPSGQPHLEVTLLKPHGGAMFDPAIAGHYEALLVAQAMGGGVLEVDDVYAAHAELTAKGVEFVSPPKEQPFGIEAVVRDGVGNWFSLTQHVTGDISGRST